MKKINFKIGAIWVSFLGVSTTIILTSGILSNTPLINAAGSSAVQPLMAAFSNKYTPADLVTQAGGSGAGIRAIIDGTKQIGMASKNPGIIKKLNEAEWSEDQRKWIERDIKTITIAWDGMGLVYKPASNDVNVDVNENTIKNIYTAFSGHQELTYEDIGVEGDKTVISPYARSGGAVVSGTADAFYKDSNIEYKVSEDEKKVLDDSLLKGNYGKFTRTTSESNSQAWSFFKNENKVGSMVYLSAGFINNNIKEIEREGFKVATYKEIKADVDKITVGYNWYRPLNLMISIKESKELDNLKELIDWILAPEEDEPIPAQIISKGGYIKLKKDQIEDLMCIDKKIETFWIATDWDIFRSKNTQTKVNNE
ncbi:MAG: PstS family phosphate ABC transporter substrate-binding protein [Metamycoplasmataceae bacterium]